MKDVHEKVFVASVSGIIWRIVSCRVVVFPKKQKELTTDRLGNLLKTRNREGPQAPGV